MKMIRPIVNLSKIIDDFDVVVVGLYGTLFDGNAFTSEVRDSFEHLYRQGKKIVIVSNTSKRVSDVVEILKQNGVNPKFFYSIVTAGEILHYQLKMKKGLFASVGQKYYAFFKDEGVFDGLDYTQVFDISKADFLYVGQKFSFDTQLEHYKPDLSFAASLNIPLVCAGNNTSNFNGGVISVDSGAFAEQYATLGGAILTTGKPDVKILQYALDGIGSDKDRIVFVGNNLQTDVKMANLFGIASVLISKGIHKHFLGEGYIPDVAKTRELANNFNVYPDYIISSFRF
ncbi:MAG: TIGR01459 family HAD-type hydrolase [Alphaproteobacteria bacterium]